MPSDETEMAFNFHCVFSGCLSASHHGWDWMVNVDLGSPESGPAWAP